MSGYQSHPLTVLMMENDGKDEQEQEREAADKAR
jgi:hypothetical protein